MIGDIDGLINAAALKYNLDPAVFRRLLIRESGLNPNAVNKFSGAQGIAQFMPETAQSLGIDPMNPRQAIPASANYLRSNMNRFGGDLAHGLAAYNWGPGNVASKGLAGAPPETQNYVNAIMGGGGTVSDAAASAPVVPRTPATISDAAASAPVAPMAQASARPPMLLPPDIFSMLSAAPSTSGLAEMFMQAQRQAQGRS